MAAINFAAVPAVATADSGSLDRPLQVPRRVWAPPVSHTGSPLARAVSASTVLQEETAGRNQINLRRGQVGLAAVTENSLIDTAARAHSTYLGLNNQTGHFETAGTTGFYGTDPSARLTAAGYAWKHVGEVVATGPFTGVQAVENLMAAIYHRFGIFDTGVDEFGAGMYLDAAQGRFTADFGTTKLPVPSAPANWIGVYPYDGQTQVQRDFFSQEESPNPIPLSMGLNRVGYPVSLHVDGARTLTVSSFSVTPINPAGSALTSFLLSSTTDANAHTPASAVATIPLTVLDYGTTYQASFSGTVDGVPLSKTWQFTTVVFVPVGVTGPASANIGDTITVKFTGGSGVYSNVAWTQYNAVVSAQQWLGPDSFQFTVNSAGTNTLQVTDSEGHQGTLQFTVASSGLPVTLTGPTTINVGDTATWTISGGTYSYRNVSWSNAAVLGSATWPSTTSLSLTAIGTGQATITVTDSAGVTGSITVNVLAAGVTTTTSTTSTTTTSSSTSTAAPTTTTTAVATTTTTVATTTTTTQTGSGPALNLVAGWNLVGNGTSTAISVSSMFADPNMVTTVWKWIAAKANWAFYTPSQADGGAAYAASKGYDFLSTVAGGEGFWVNAKAAFTAQLPGGTAITSASFQGMPSGWNLIAIGDNKTPSQFNQFLSATPPSPGVIPLNLTTLWAWEPVQANWFFYAPSLEAQGGTALSSYITSKGYLDFTAANKTLQSVTGFWVNKP